MYDNRKLVNYLPQDNFLPNHIKVNTIIDLFCDKEHVNIIKEHSFIQSMLKKKSKELSGGEKRLLEIFLILYSDAKYILIDEPFNGVAPVYKEEIKKLIKTLSAKKGFIRITSYNVCYTKLLRVLS